MAYTPTEWVCGDIITAEKLNKLENGLAECCSGGGTEPLTVNFTWSDEFERYYADKTYGEVKEAYMSGRIVVLIIDTSWYTAASLFETDNTGYVGYGDGNSAQTGPCSSYEEMLAHTLQI